MQIKVFKAATMKEAVAAMRAELGSKAVILHSKKYKESGLLGLRTREVVEITAAVEDSPETKDIPPAQPVPAVQPANIAAAKYKKTAADSTKTKKVETPPDDKKISEEDVKKLQSVLKRVKENSPIEIESQSDAEILNSQEESKKVPPQKVQPEQITATPPPAQPVETKPSESLRIEEKSPTSITQEQFAQFQAMMFAQFQQMQAAQKPPEVPAVSKSESLTAEVESPEKIRIRQLEDEIAQMKLMLAQALGKNPKASITLQEALKRQEVSEEILNEMADTNVDYQSSAAKWTLASYFGEHLKFADGIRLSRRGAKIVALVGTTGVGKTTTLAKIAAKFVLEHGISPALITADTYRISAVEQLKTYSDILGLPLEIVYTPQELALAIDRHQDSELILIDTAGRSQYSEAQMHELQEFLKINPRIEKHLAISASVKLNDAKEIVKKFSAVEPEKIIITKIDETGNFGTVINLLRYENLPLSYLTTGQSVPDDISVGTADALADLMIKKINAMIV